MTEPVFRPASSQPYMPTPEQYMDSMSRQRSKGSSNSEQPSPQRQSSERGSSEPQPKVKRKRRIGRWVALVFLVLMLATVAYGIYLVTIVAKISTQPLNFGGLTADSNGRTNVLLLGVGDPGHSGQNLSDTIIVMSLNNQQKRVAQISVPRDLRVDVPGYGEEKINGANADGGPGLAEQTVSNTLAIPIDYYVKTDFTGLQEIVDAVGGIQVNVTQELVDPEYPCANNQYKVCGLDIKPGLQHMDGATALEYVRCRKGTCGNDFGRAARQQEVLDLVRAKVLTWQVLLNPVKLTKIVMAIRDNVQTNMSAFQLVQFALGWNRAHSNKPVHLVYSTSPGGYLVGAGSSSDLLPIGDNFGPMQAAAQNIFGK